MAIPDLSPQKLMTLMQLLNAYERGELRGTAPGLRKHADRHRVVLCKADATINGTSESTSGPGSGDVSVWGWNSSGTLADMGWNETAYNFHPTAVTTGVWHKATREEIGGRLIIDSPYPMKPLIRFRLNVTLTTTMASVSCSLSSSDQWGFGVGHQGSTAITVHNLATATAGSYVFSGSTGHAGLAMWDSGSDFRMIQMQCS